MRGSSRLGCAARDHSKRIRDRIEKALTSIKATIIDLHAICTLSKVNLAPRSHRMLLGLSLLVVASLLSPDTSRADPTTYQIDQTIGSGSVVGTIITDGNTGVLTSGDITQWNLQLNGAGATATITNGDANAAVLVVGSDLTATASTLSFNYSGTDNGLFVLQDGLYSGNTYFCSATSSGACAKGATVVPQYYYDPTTQNVPLTGEQVIATGSCVNSAQAVNFGPYTDNVAYQVACPPHPGVTGSDGLYQYTYNVTYQGTATLVLPLFEAGDATNLTSSSCALAPYKSLSSSLQQDFGTEYQAAISCALPYEANLTSYPISFESAYAPTEVTIGLISDGIVYYLDPPIPNDPPPTAVTEPATVVTMLTAIAILAGMLSWRARWASRPC